MLRDLLYILLVVWLISVLLPINSGRPFLQGNVGYIIGVILVVILVIDFLLPALHGI